MDQRDLILLLQPGQPGAVIGGFKATGAAESRVIDCNILGSRVFGQPPRHLGYPIILISALGCADALGDRVAEEREPPGPRLPYSEQIGHDAPTGVFTVKDGESDRSLL